VIQELGHCLEPLPARGTAWDNHAPTALRDGRRLVNEVAEVVAMDFCFKGGEQF
jgi:hypothetical protein